MKRTGIFKKIGFCGIVLLALVSIIVGSISNAAHVNAGAGTETEKKYSAEDTWRAKTYMTLFATCASDTVSDDTFADVFTIAGAWEGKWVVDKNYVDKENHNSTLYTDPLLGRQSKCTTIDNLVATTYNNMAKIGGNTLKESWSDLRDGGSIQGDNLVADFYVGLGFRAWVDESPNTLYGGKNTYSDERARMIDSYKKNGGEDYVLSLTPDGSASGQTDKIRTEFVKKLEKIAGVSSIEFTDAEQYWLHYYGVLNNCDVNNTGFQKEVPTTYAGQTILSFPYVNDNEYESLNKVSLETRYLATAPRSGYSERNYHYSLPYANDGKIYTGRDFWTPCVGDDALKVMKTDATGSGLIGYGFKTKNTGHGGANVEYYYKEIDINNFAKAALVDYLKKDDTLIKCADDWKAIYEADFKNIEDTLDSKIKEQKADYNTQTAGQRFVIDNQSAAYDYDLCLTNGGHYENMSEYAKYACDANKIEEIKNQIANIDLVSFGVDEAEMRNYGACLQGYNGSNYTEKEREYECKKQVFKRFRDGKIELEGYGGEGNATKTRRIDNAVNNIILLDNVTSYKSNIHQYELAKEKAREYVTNNIPTSDLVSTSAKRFDSTGRLDDNPYSSSATEFPDSKVQRVLTIRLSGDGKDSFQCNATTAFENERQELEKITGISLPMPNDIVGAWGRNFNVGEGGADMGDVNINGNIVSTCENSGAMGWILCPIARGLADSAYTFYENNIAMELEIDSGELSTENGGSGVYQAWRMAVGIANTILVILFIVVIFSQLTGYGIDNYGIKRILPKLIMMAILINLSYFICQLAVDVSNIVGAGIKGLLDLPIQETVTGAGAKSTPFITALTGILEVVGISLAVTTVAVKATEVVKGGWASVGGALIAILVVLLLCLVAVVFFFVLLIIRKIAVLALVILSPLAFACYALPNTKKLFTKWFDGFKRLLLVYPICGFVIGLSLLLCKVINSTGSSMIQNITCIIILTYPYFFIPKFISKALDSITSIGSLVSGASRGIRKGAKNGILKSKPVENLKQRAENNKKSAEAQRNRERSERLAKSYEKAAIKAQERAGKQRSGLFAGMRQKSADRRAEQSAMRSLSATEEALKSRSQSESALAQTKYSAEQGPYTERALEAQARISSNEFNKRAATAENPPIKVEIDMARSQAIARVSSEQEKAFMDQFAGMDKKELQTKLQETLADLSSKDPATNKQFANLEKAQALKELLKKQDATEEILQSFGKLNTSDSVEGILGDSENSKFLIEAMANSGSVIGKGYSKYLGDIKSRRANLTKDKAEVDADTTLSEAEKTQKKAELERRATAPVMSLKDWMSKGDGERAGSELSDLKSYLDYTYGSSSSFSKMSKDDLKFLKSKDAADARAKLFAEQPKAFKDAILGKVGEEKRLAGDILSGQLDAAYQAGGEAEYIEKVSGLGLAANDLAQLNMDNINALAGVQSENDPNAGAKMESLKKALAGQIATAAGDPRIRHRIPPEIQKLLGFPPENKTENTKGDSDGGQPSGGSTGDGDSAIEDTFRNYPNQFGGGKSEPG